MSGYAYANGQGSVIARFALKDSSQTTPNNKGLNGLTSASAGLIIGTIADTEAAATVYTQAGGTIQGISTLGTFAAPSASNCRFAPVDATNFPGWYELQFANARYGVTGAKSIAICFPAVSGLTLAQMDIVIPLTVIDPYNPRSVAQTQLSGSSAFGTLGQRPTLEQAVMEIRQFLYESNWSGQNNTIKDVDHSTTIRTALANASSGATSIQQNG